MKHRISVGLIIGLLGGCGGDERSPTLAQGDTAIDTESNGGSGGGSGGRAMTASTAGSGSMGTEAPEGAPVVSITQPPNVTDPTQEDVLTPPETTVLCQVSTSPDDDSLAFDASTILIELLDSEGEVVASGPGLQTTVEGQYSADFILTNVEPGALRFRCSAADTSSPPLVGFDSVSVLVDHGPNIIITSPLLDSAHPLEGNLRFQFRVEPATLAEEDPGASLKSVSLSLNGVDLELPDVSVSGGEYDLTVNLADSTLFPDPLEGVVAMLITADNSREPVATVRTREHSFIVDSSGPIVSIDSPNSNQVIGGEVVLRFTVIDEDPGSGVDPNSVVVTLGTVDYYFDPTGPWSNDKASYVLRFDSAALVDVTSQLTINVRAVDRAGNDSIGESILLYLDNFPPRVDLDPDNMRAQKQSGDPRSCSDAFDPVGADAVNDLETGVLRTALFRAMIEDQTNQSSGQSVLYFAGVDPNASRLYIQPNLAVPLLIDTTGDGVCDEIGSIDDLQFVTLNGIPRKGTPSFTGIDPDGVNAPSGVNCPRVTPPEDPAPPIAPAKNLCTNELSDMSYVAADGIEGRPPMIFGVGSLNALQCTGSQWEVGAFTDTDGWVCLAGRAVDGVGNIGISRPLRICIDDTLKAGTPDCGTAPPSCTDGCTPPARIGTSIVRQ